MIANKNKENLKRLIEELLVMMMKLLIMLEKVLTNLLVQENKIIKIHKLIYQGKTIYLKEAHLIFSLATRK
jgi:hypothetical protein